MKKRFSVKINLNINNDGIRYPAKKIQFLLESFRLDTRRKIGSSTLRWISSLFADTILAEFFSVCQRFGDKSRLPRPDNRGK